MFILPKEFPGPYATKVWITKTGGCLLCHNNSQIPPKTLRNIMEIVEARSKDVLAKWTAYFGEIHYFR